MLKRLIYADRVVIGKDAFGNDIEVEGQFFTWIGRHLIEAHVLGGAALVAGVSLLQ